MRRLVILFSVSLVLIANPLNGQEKDLARGKVGLTFPSTGIIWHFSDRVALLGNAGYSFNWSEYSVSPISSSGGSLTVGSALRFYAREWKGIHLFLSPKYSLVRATSISEPGLPVGTTAKGTALNHQFVGTWGVQYPVSGRVNIVGEYGVQFSRSASSSSPASVSGDRHSYIVGSYGSWGLILYLN